MPGHFSSGLCFLLIFSLASFAASEDDTVVTTSSGPVKGKRLLAGSANVTAFLGIPYAQPPLGKLRFQKPLPHQPWSQVLEATSFGNSCFQLIFFTFPDSATWAANTPLSEDCLFLNVWVPHPRPSMPLPVLVWIHGGGFLTGTTSLDLYNGASLAATEKVIVVSMNYRLGALGFLSFPPSAPGNMGLLDQQLALHWVKENAAAFGGDPAQLTIFGHSAGAASVGFHLLSPGSQPLFARAVLQSGSVNAVWAWISPEKAKQRALALGQVLGCAEGNGSAVVSCLQGKKADQFIQYELSQITSAALLLDFPFIPTTDGEFLPDDPQNLLDTGRIQPKPVLIGATANEGSTFVVLSFPGTRDGLITWEQLLKGVKTMVRNATEEVIQAVARKYSEEFHGPAQYRSAMAHCGGDYFFICPIAEVASKMVQTGSAVYAYYFSHHTSGSVWPQWVGAPHGAELPYLFGTLASALVANRTFTEAEDMLSRRVMRYWAEFARSGNPTGSAAKEVQWPQYNITQQNFLHLSTEPPQVMQPPPPRFCDFWTKSLKAAQPSTDGPHAP